MHAPFRNFYYFIVFLYFLTLSADVLHLEFSLFKIKIGNLIAAFLFLLLFYSRKGLVLCKDILIPFTAILLSILISASGSIYPLRCFGYAGVYLFEFGCYFVVPFTLLFHLNRDKILKIYFLSFITMGCYAFSQLLFSMGGVYVPFLRQVIEIGGLARPHGLSYEPSFYALYMSSYVMFCNAYYLFSEKRESLKKLFFVNWLLLLSTSTSGFLAYGLFLPFGVLFRRYAINFKKKIVILSFSLSSIIFFLFVFAPKIVQFFFKFFTLSFALHHSFRDRWKGILYAWDAFCDHPFFGVGIGGIGPYLFYKEKVGILPLSSFGLSLQEVEIFDPANVATEILGSLGLFGVFAFFLLANMVWNYFKAVLKAPPEQRSIGLSLFISLFVMILLLQCNPGLFRCYVWVHMGIALGYSASLSSHPLKTA